MVFHESHTPSFTGKLNECGIDFVILTNSLLERTDLGAAPPRAVFLFVRWFVCDLSPEVLAPMASRYRFTSRHCEP